MPSDNIDAQLKRVQAELDRARASLAAFGSAAHHDLNAPLRHIRMFAELIERDSTASLSADARDYLNRIAGSVDRAASLVEALSEFARFASTSAISEPVDLTALAKDVANTFAAALDDVDGGVDIGVLPVGLADRNRLARVLSCLFDNAIKHRACHAVTLTVGAAPAPPGQVAITVADTGPGLPSGQEEAAFELLRQFAGGAQDAGAGMGLALSRQLMEMMGGAIRYDAGVDTGAAFLLTLPGVE